MESPPIVYLTRTETFSACHRLHSHAMDRAGNERVYGKCNNTHGHNYKVEVTVRGPVSQDTGMVINIADLKGYMNDAIMKSLDHKSLDNDVNYFASRVSTTENLAVFIWEAMSSVMPNPGLLHKVKIHETEKNVVTYKGKRG